jgi:hypothetical protein
MYIEFEDEALVSELRPRVVSWRIRLWRGCWAPSLFASGERPWEWYQAASKVRPIAGVLPQAPTTSREQCRNRSYSFTNVH